MNKTIDVRGLTKAFQSSANMVDGASFPVNEGQVFSLLGPNGAGKTTTIRMLTTLTSITKGEAFVGGIDLGREPGGVRELCRLGLAKKAMADGVYFGVTPRGLEFLDTFWRMKGFLEELGEPAGH